MKTEDMMIYEEYSGKPYALLFAVTLGVLMMAGIFVLAVVGLVNLIL